MAAFIPNLAELPVLLVPVPSLLVVAVKALESGSTVTPAAGATALSWPCSSSFILLQGIEATSSLLALACSATISLVLSTLS
jgi:hypothetical protein